MSTERERIKNEAYQGSNILYEDDYLIFVKINSLAAAKYFLPTRISTAYNRYYYKGNLYSIYDKQYSGDVNQTPRIITIHKIGLSDNENNIDIYDENHEKLTMGDIIKEYPNLKEIIVKEIGLSNIYNVLNSILNGVEYTEYQLKQIDPLISKFKYNETTPSKSMVTVRFDRLDEFLKIFDKDESEINFIERVFSPYYDYHQFYPEDYANDDWKEGYLIREFSPENLEKVKQILKFLSPAHSKLENDDDFKKASILLLTTHDRKIDYIIGDYLSEMEECKRNTLIEEIESDLCDPFINYGIFSKGNCMKSYVTTVRVLVSLYKMFKTDYDSLIDIFTKLGKNVKTYNYEEDHYSTDCSKKHFDDETFQRRVSSNLDDILDTIEENNDYFEDIEGYKNIINNILSKYEIDKLYNTPVDKGTFRIVDIDPKTNKIDVNYWAKNKTGGERRRYDIQGFNDFLYNQELFEQKIRKLNKY